jgi:DNA-binding transcriptional regulator YiaG
MTRADNTINLLRAAADKRDTATRHTTAVIEELARTGTHVSVAVVAHSAGVSRSWLYEQPDLLADINHLRERKSAVPIPAKQRSTEESTRQRLDAARAEIERLRTENAMLREQVARTLGEQRLRR